MTGWSWLDEDLWIWLPLEIIQTTGAHCSSCELVSLSGKRVLVPQESCGNAGLLFLCGWKLDETYMQVGVRQNKPLVYSMSPVSVCLSAAAGEAVAGWESSWGDKDLPVQPAQGYSSTILLLPLHESNSITNTITSVILQLLLIVSLFLLLFTSLLFFKTYQQVQHKLLLFSSSLLLFIRTCSRSSRSGCSARSR